MKLASLIVFLVACLVQNALGILTWDLRAVSVAGGGAINGPKSVTLTAAATSVTFDVWAVVTGTNGVADETLLSGYGMLLSNATAAPSPVTLDPNVAGNHAILTTGTTLKGSFSVILPKGNLVPPWTLRR